MKLRIHSVAVLFAAVLAPSALFAQAPAGVARVDSETYFDTVPGGAPFSQTNYSTAEEFSSGSYPAEAESSWDQPGFVGTSASHGGLLGKTYLRAGYVYNGVEDPAFSAIDNSFDGWDIELNIPFPWLVSDDVGLDFFTEYENRRFSGTMPGTSVSASLENHVSTIGS
jgi:hypothetical protein